MSTCLSAVCLTRKTSVISYIKQHVREGPGARAACVLSVLAEIHEAIKTIKCSNALPISTLFRIQ